MKYNEKILARVRRVEDKYNIHYALPDGRLYHTLRTLYIFVFAYASAIHALCVLSPFVYYGSPSDPNFPVAFVTTVGIGTALLTASFVLLFTKGRSVGALLGLFPASYLLVEFYRELADPICRFGVKPMYWWRHFAPLALTLIFLIGMAVISIRAYAKTKAMYQRIQNGLYEVCRQKYGDGTTTPTEEDWEAFLETYTPYGNPMA